MTTKMPKMSATVSGMNIKSSLIILIKNKSKKYAIPRKKPSSLRLNRFRLTHISDNKNPKNKCNT